MKAVVEDKVVEEQKNDANSEEVDDNEEGKWNSSETANQTKSTFYYEDLSENDEVFTLQYPKSLSLSDVENILLDKNKTHNGLVVDVLETKEFLTIGLPSKQSGGQLVNANVQGHIVIKKNVEIPQVHLEEIINDDIEFPDVEVRHPLLGADWEDHMKSVEKILKRQKLNLSKSKPKKSKTNVGKEIDDTNEEEKVSPKKKKKK